MKRGWWELKDNLDPLKCLVFPKYQGSEYEPEELSDDGRIDLELFDDIVKSTIKLNDTDREHIVSLIKQGVQSGEVVQE